LQHLIRE